MKWEHVVSYIELVCISGLQNIDTLEHVAGLSEDKLVLAHGSFHTSHCIDCKHAYTKEWIKGIVP